MQYFWKIKIKVKKGKMVKYSHKFDMQRMTIYSRL